MSTRIAFVLFPALVCSLALPAFAADEVNVRARFDGRGGGATNFNLDPGLYGGGGTGGARLRLDFDLHTAQSLTLRGQVDLEGGTVFGADPELVGQSWTSPYSGVGGQYFRVNARHLYLTWETLYGQLRVGQQGSNWGLGILANDGDGSSPWGVKTHGDIVERVLFASKPFIWFTGADWAGDFYVALGMDLVMRDENAELLEGDRALQGILSLFWQKEKGEREVGIYLAYRNQLDRPYATTGQRAKLEVLAVDVFAAYRVDVTDDLSWRTRFEGVRISGFTTRLRPESAPEGVDVLGVGWALNTEVKFESLGLDAGLWAGYASGDNNSEDTRLTRMRFDPDFRPSLILFDTVLAAHSARAVALASDPARSNIPQAGSQFLPTTGSIAGAWFVGPILEYRTPIDGVTAKVGMIYAQATADVVDPYTSFANGGVPTNIYDQPANKRSLGIEIDVGVRYTRKLKVGDQPLELGISLEYGKLFPGPAFTMAVGRMAAVDAVYGNVHLVWRMP